MARIGGSRASLLEVRLGLAFADPKAEILYQHGIPEDVTTSDRMCPIILLAKAVLNSNRPTFDPTGPCLCITDTCQFWLGDAATGTCPFERFTGNGEGNE